MRRGLSTAVFVLGIAVVLCGAAATARGAGGVGVRPKSLEAIKTQFMWKSLFIFIFCYGAFDLFRCFI